MVLFQHADGRAVVTSEGDTAFTDGDPRWVRNFPVEIRWHSSLAPAGTVPQDVTLMINIASEIEALAKRLIDVEISDYDEAPPHRAMVVRLMHLGGLIGLMAEGKDEVQPALEKLYGVVR